MKKKIGLILNILLIIFEVLGFTLVYTTGAQLTPAIYTEDSNLICLIASLMYVIYYCRGKANNKYVHIFRFMATLNLVLTFLVTLFLLSNDYGLYEIMIQDEFIFFHTLCPIVSLISYLFFEKYRSHKANIMIKAPIFTVVYGVVMYTLNITKLYSGPYEFMKVYDYSLTTTLVTLLGMSIGTIVITFALFELKKKIKI